jgi:tripeptidyl-peptidase-1
MAKLLFGLLAMGAAADWVVKERDVPTYNAQTSMWVKQESPSAEHPVTLTVALRLDEARRNELERIFWEVSDPEHLNYGKYRSVAEITEVLAVPQKNIDTVSQYFKQSGATSVVVAAARDTIQVTIPAGAAETALNTKLHHFTHLEHTRAKIVRASRQYALPGHIAELVDMVGELLQFPRLPLKHLHDLTASSSGWTNACESSSCNNLVTPAVLAERYKIPTSASNSAGNSMAVAEFQGQYYEDSDLALFSKSCKRDVTVAANVGKNQESAGVESELDIEYIKGVAPEIPLTVVYNGQYSLLDWANQITNLENSPLVHSVSYGNDEVQQSSTEYMYTCNTAFMKAGARGISILFASGDQGVCGRSGCGLFTHAVFHPDFPGASPYITAVGGTDFAGTVIGDETAWRSGGGGFSNTFGQPTYQKAAVAAYLADKSANFPPQKLWNATGRGYPDLAALGGQKNPYCVATSGRFGGVAGTSASCPVAAGIFAKINGLRLAAGKPALGFLNPFIYKNPDAFFDVTSGTNSDAKKYGFTAVKGWDAATGFGTPNYEALAKAAMAAVEAMVVV